MTRRGVISIHDYPEHLNPFREDEDEVHRKFTRKERGAPVPSPRHITPSQSPVKPERPPLPNRTKIKDKENEVGRRDEDKYFRQGTKPKKKRPAPLPPSPNKPTLSPGVSDGSLDKTTPPASQQNSVAPEKESPGKEERSVTVATDSESPKTENNGTIADPAVGSRVEGQGSPVNGTAAAPEDTPAAPVVQEDESGPSSSESMGQDVAKEDPKVPKTEEVTESMVEETREEATCNGKSDETKTANGDATEDEVADPQSNRREDGQIGETDEAAPADTTEIPEEQKSERTNKTICSDEVASKEGDPQLVADKSRDSESPSKTPQVDPQHEEMNGTLQTEEQVNVITDGGGLDESHSSTEATTLAPQADNARKE